jgi:hypothetical protein
LHTAFLNETQSKPLTQALKDRREWEYKMFKNGEYLNGRPVYTSYKQSNKKKNKK